MKLDKSKWLWLDLEMTGLDPKHDRIIEVAAIITDTNLNELATWSSAVNQSEEALEGMKQAVWAEFDQETGEKVQKGTVYDMHVASGLIDQIGGGVDEDEAQDKLVEMIKQNFDGVAIIAGNSIHQDRRFIRQWWPRVDAMLYHRMLDVTAFKIVLEAQDHLTFKKSETHAALNDIRESMGELKFYLEHLKTRE